MTTDSTGVGEVFIQRFAKVWVNTVVDDDASALTGRQATQICQALFGDAWFCEWFGDCDFFSSV